MKKIICKYVAENLEGITYDEVIKILEIPSDETLGDYAIPCFSFAKLFSTNPNQIATMLKEVLSHNQKGLGIEKIDVVGGYCNIYMNKTQYIKTSINQIRKLDFGVEKIGADKTICMDYSSPNIAKKFHVGHLRTTIIGNSLYQIYKKLGYHVIRINHLGDWGTQFGKLIVAYKNWSSKEEVEQHGIDELLRIYVKFDAEAKESPKLMEEARAWFVKLEQDDPEAITIWNWFKQISLVEYERIYQLLGVSFDSYNGESFYRDQVPSLISELEKKHLLKDSQGAKIIDLDAYDMPPCLITKSDGGSIYHSRDIAAAIYRKKTYHFDKCLYVTGLEQSLHFKQVFQSIELMHYPWAKDLVHIPYGLVSLNGIKLSTRTGNIVYAEEILREAIRRAKNLIHKKNPSLCHKELVAKQVGVGAIIFHDLYHQRIKNIDFSWEEVLNFDGTTGPYVQYTYARAKSILRKNSNLELNGDIDYHVLTDEITISLVKVLVGYEDAIYSAAERNEPSVIAKYLIALATTFNRFYHECPVLTATKDIKKARLLVVDLVQMVLKDACMLLGMECPEEM